MIQLFTPLKRIDVLYVASFSGLFIVVAPSVFPDIYYKILLSEVLLMMVYQSDLQPHVQFMPVTAKVLSSDLTHGEV